jgi:hypothetical protein
LNHPDVGVERELLANATHGQIGRGVRACRHAR